MDLNKAVRAHFHPFDHFEFTREGEHVLLHTTSLARSGTLLGLAMPWHVTLSVQQAIRGGILCTVVAFIPDLKSLSAGHDCVCDGSLLEDVKALHVALIVQSLHDVHTLSDHILEAKPCVSSGRLQSTANCKMPCTAS